MKKKIVIIMLCIIVVLIFLFIWLRGAHPFDDINSNDIEKIIIYHPGDNENVFSRPEDKDKVLSLLREIHLIRTLPNVGDGGLNIDLYFTDGERSRLTLSSDIIVIDGKVYHCDRDYCDDFRKLCEEL